MIEINYLEEAKKQLMIASTELNKPEEDLIRFSVCNHTKMAIEHYLLGFLKENGATIVNSTSLEKLYQACITIDPSFNVLDKNKMSCFNVGIDNYSCENISEVKDCFSLANDLDDFFRNKEKE